MRVSVPATILALTLAACAPAPAPDAAQGQQVWRLSTVDNLPFGAEVSITLSDKGRHISGQGPCNGCSADIINDAYPAVRVINVTSTKMACPKLAEENYFLEALSKTTGQIAAPELLIFSSTSGHRLEFLPAGG